MFSAPQSHGQMLSSAGIPSTSSFSNGHPKRQSPLLLQVRGAVAEYERQLITDRMRRERLAKLRSGQLLPWSRAPYGYLLDPEHPRDPHGLKINPVTAAIGHQIFAWYTD